MVSVFLSTLSSSFLLVVAVAPKYLESELCVVLLGLDLTDVEDTLSFPRLFIVAKWDKRNTKLKIQQPSKQSQIKKVDTWSV